MASALEWIPETLYNTAVSAIVEQYSRHRVELRMLPENVQFDVYFQLYNKGRLCLLAIEFSDLYIFSRVLKVHGKRHLLHHAFQALMDHSHDGQVVANSLAMEYRSHCHSLRHAIDDRSIDRTIQLGFSLGSFMDDAGWSEPSEQVFLACASLCNRHDTPAYWTRAYECAVRLMHVRTCHCKYDVADESYHEAMRLAHRIESHGQHVNKALLYTERCSLLYSKSLYDESYQYCCLALQEVTDKMPKKNIVDVFRQCGKVCVVKREFKKAELLIKHAVEYSREYFGMKHHKYSDALIDYGFYLLNVDSINKAVKVYQTALDIRQSVFGGNNIHVANAHEDLAYASYVQEYSSGKFSDAQQHAERAIEMINKILPSDHLLTASSKRVKALILEEIAIDSNDKSLEDQLLHESQELHLASLALAEKAFGESNVQTAKHYGNLGRLYQSMRYYKKAQSMHLKAIEIKERLLGPDDYEVALSVGHLASLYNYDMQMYVEAERLYLRSIEIAKKSFGPGYSGLEYDYRGLIRLYHQKGDYQQAIRFGTILQEWNQLRTQVVGAETKPLDFVSEPRVSTNVVSDFFGNEAEAGTSQNTTTESLTNRTVDT